jgi:hypothetical protein
MIRTVLAGSVLISGLLFALQPAKANWGLWTQRVRVGAARACGSAKLCCNLGSACSPDLLLEARHLWALAVRLLGEGAQEAQEETGTDLRTIST